MWIQVIGATGTGKEHVLNLIKKDGFELISEPVLPFDTALLKEFAHAAARIKNDLLAASVKDRKDVVTIRSFYESRDIFVPISKELTEISQEQFDLFNLAYSCLKNDFVQPPDVVIYCKATKINALNRAALRGVQISDEAYNRQSQLYEEYAKRVRVPLIEIDALANPTEVNRNLEFGISSIKTANLSNRSVWERSMFWEENVVNN